MAFNNESLSASPTSTAESIQCVPSATDVVDSEVVIAVFGTEKSEAREFCELLSKQSDGAECASTPAFVPRSFEAFPLDGKSVRLVCIPDLDNIQPLGNKARVLIALARFLVSEHQAGRKLAGAVYTHPVGHEAPGDMIPRHISMLRAVCGSDFSENIVVATTHWDCIEKEKGSHLHENIHPLIFQTLVKEGAVLLKHDNGIDSAQAIVRHLIEAEPKAPLLQTELMEEGERLEDTDIGWMVRQSIHEQVRNRRKRMGRLQQDMDNAEKPELLADLARKYSKLEDEIVQLEEAVQGLVDFCA